MIPLQDIVFTDRQPRRPGPILRTFFPGKILGKIPRKIFPKKCWEKIEFSAEKVLKKLFFSKKFRGIFRGKGFSAEKMYEKLAR
jgi:hypothetical protein